MASAVLAVQGACPSQILLGGAPGMESRAERVDAPGRARGMLPAGRRTPRYRLADGHRPLAAAAAYVASAAPRTRAGHVDAPALA
ncbi:Protein of unknown function, partial [Gryllus bimaculatus]